MKRILVAVAAAIPIAAWGAAPASAASIVVPIPATQVSSAGSLQFILTPPPCGPSSARRVCVNVVPGLFGIVLVPPGPCVNACPPHNSAMKSTEMRALRSTPSRSRVSRAKPVSAATTAARAVVVPIPATPVSGPGSVGLVLLPPDPCRSTNGGPICVNVVPGVAELVLSPPDPCRSVCQAAKR